MAHRLTESEAKELIQSQLPNVDYRRQYLSILADAIKEVNRLAPNQWTVSVQKKTLRLVVGHYYTYTLWVGDEVWLALDGDNSLTSEQPGLLDSDKYLPGWRLNQPDDPIVAYLDKDKQPFSKNGYYNLRKADPKLWWMVERLSFGFIANVIDRGVPMTASSRKAHEAGVLKYMRAFLDRSIPEPRI